MLFCSNCGSKVTDEMSYCPQCGQKLLTTRAGVKDASMKTSDYSLEPAAEQPEPVTSPGVRKGKLYREWVKYAGLPQEPVPEKKGFRLMSGETGFRLDHRVLFIFMGVIILILCAVLIFLIIKLG